MALDLDCNTTIKYTGDGVQTDFLYPFPIIEDTDLNVAFFDEEKNEYYEVTTGWSKPDSTSLVRFVLPPAAGQKLIIYRLTEVDPVTFHPGHPVKAGDLNDNFEQLESAIEDNRCIIELKDDVYDERYWRKYDETIYSDDEWISSDDYVASTAAIDGAIDDAIHSFTMVAIGPNPPSDPKQGDLWWSTLQVNLFVWYFDGDSYQWVDASPLDVDINGNGGGDVVEGIYVREKFLATGPVSEFTLVGGVDYIPGQEQIFLNGSLLERDTDYTANDGSTFTLEQPTLAGDQLELFSTNSVVDVSVDLSSQYYTYPGGVQRTVQDRLEDILSVKDFGAVGDGLTDDTEAIKLALASATTGATVFFPENTFRITEALTLSGLNRVTITGKAKLLADYGEGSFDGFLTIINCTDCTIDGLIFENAFVGSNSVNIGIELKNLNSLSISNCAFYNFRYCILGRQTANSVRVCSNYFSANPSGLTGCVLNGDRCVIDSNVFHEYKDTACGMQGGASNGVISNNIISTNTMSDNNGYTSLGIVVEENAHNIIVSGNSLDGQYVEGDDDLAGANSLIKVGNNATNNCPRNVTITSNTIRNSGNYGIFLVNSGDGDDPTNIVISNNVVSNCKTAGIRNMDGANVATTSNSVSDCNIGIQDQTSFSTITSNVVRNCNTGMNVKTGGVASIVANTSTNCSTRNWLIQRISPTRFMLGNMGISGSTGQEYKKVTIEQKLTLAPNQNSTIRVLQFKDQFRFTILDFQFTNNAGTPVSTVNLQTNSSINGDLNGTVNHGSSYVTTDETDYFVTSTNNTSSDKYMRINALNTEASEITVYFSITYAIGGGL